MTVHDMHTETPVVVPRDGTEVTVSAIPANSQLLTASYWRGLMLVALVLGVAWINLSRVFVDSSELDQAIHAPMVGFLAPDFTLPSVDGQSVQLSALRGTPVVLNFWATWCPPCRAEMPALEALWQQHNRGDIIVLGVDEGERAAAVTQFARDTANTTFPLLLDTRLTIGTAYNVRMFPSTFFIDADGRIQDIRVGGPLNAAALAGSVEKIAH